MIGLILPGLGGGPASFAALMARLGPAWRFTPLPEHDEVGALADAILNQAPDRFVLAGHSLGGYVALAVARAAPERLAGLALVSAGLTAEAPPRRRLREARMAAIAAEGFEPGLRAEFEAFVAPARRADPDCWAAFRADQERLGVKALLAQNRAAMGRPDATAGFAAYAGPVLVAAGDQDRLMPPERVQAAARLARCGAAAILPACGHLAPLEAGQALADVLAAWADPLR